MEPYKIKIVESLPVTSREERVQALTVAGYNPFRVPAKLVTFDLLTDSGTGTMSSRQWSALLEGDETYAGARSFHKFESAAREITRFKYILPVHQGRGAERILCKCTLSKDKIVLFNTCLDTTKAHIQHSGAIGMDISVKQSKSGQFNGDIDCRKLQQYITRKGSAIALVIVTVTNPIGGGQPVSMAAIRQASQICRKHDILFYVDGSRYAENSWFIKAREKGYANKSPLEIAQEMFSCFDGCIMSIKKDGMCNAGGFLATNDSKLYEVLSQQVILCEGFLTYGGMAGRDMEAAAVGLTESLDENSLRFRIELIAAFGEMLKKRCVPMIEPIGGHAVCIDAGTLLSHLDSSQFPAWALNCALFIEGAIRGTELGNVMNGVLPDGTMRDWPKELLQLAVPRRSYTMSHLQHVSDVIGGVVARRTAISGLRILQASNLLRQFSAVLAPIRNEVIPEKVNDKNNYPHRNGIVWK